MKWHHDAGLRLSSQVSGLTCREMTLCRGDVGVGVEECRLDEHRVGIAGQSNNALHVGFMKRRIGHVGDFLPGHDAQQLGLQLTQGDAVFA